MSYTTLISASELSSHLSNDNWRIFDCRFDLGDTDWGWQLFQESHIPNASYAHLDRDLSSPIKPGITGRHPLPDVSRLASFLSEHGVDDSVQVIAYDQGPGMFAARFWWLLRWLGHDKVAVLDGGWKNWQAQELEQTASIKTFTARQFAVQANSNLIASIDEVMACTQQADKRLIDVRAADRFRGENETLDAVAGHIPNAVSMPFMMNLNEQTCFKTKTELTNLYQDIFDDIPNENRIIYCGSGVTATHTILALQHAGMGLAKLYPGSWSHWITDPARPIATGND